ncbi:Cell wall endopeptidase family M23/M37 [Salmonella enterica subsp. enterica serovar Typhimurium]|nr:Cell wall endopeptidase family M23/M37 [Salmonella enterica subsp. enterica serovar Typhimurium]
MQQIARSVALAFNNLPRPHRVMLGSLTVLTLAVAVWRPYVYHPESAPIVKTIELEKSEIRSLLPEASEPSIRPRRKMKLFLRMSWTIKPQAKSASMNTSSPQAIR